MEFSNVRGVGPLKLESLFEMKIFLWPVSIQRPFGCQNQTNSNGFTRDSKLSKIYYHFSRAFFRAKITSATAKSSIFSKWYMSFAHLGKLIQLCKLWSPFTYKCPSKTQPHTLSKHLQQCDTDCLANQQLKFPTQDFPLLFWQRIEQVS